MVRVKVDTSEAIAAPGIPIAGINSILVVTIRIIKRIIQ